MPSLSIARKRNIQYVFLSVILILIYFLLRDSAWEGSKLLHTLMEVVATILAMSVGILTLVRFYTNRSNVLLFVGTGFLGTALLDGYHTIVTSKYFDTLFPSPPPSLIPWSWNSSRLLLSLLIFVSWWTWRLEGDLEKKGKIKENVAYIGIGIFTIISCLFFALFPLPRAYYPEWIIPRPEELIPAFFFLLALIGYYRKGSWKSDHLHFWLVNFLIFSFMSQVLFMSFSITLFDVMFDTAHLLKIVSYMCMLTGLFVSTFYLYQQAEKDKTLLAVEIKERTKIESLLKMQKLDLERVNEELKAFAYTISHDLRSPLRSIISFSSFVKKKSQNELTKKSQEDLDTVIKNAKKMNMMMEDILEFSRIGRIEESKARVNIKSLVDEALALRAADINSLKATIDVKGEFPVVSCYKVRVIQIFLNLIGNSLKYIPEGKRPKITIGCIKKDNFNWFFVQDNGIGIKKEFHSKIFKVFQRLHTETSPYKGTGIGLSNVKKIVDLHGGEITVESEEGKGSKFYFTLEGIPKKKLGEILVEDKVITEEQLNGALSKQTAFPEFDKMTNHLLVVDDELDSIDLFKRMIEEHQADISVSYVNSGQEAMDYVYGKQRYADRNKYPMCHLILLDINMPGMSGFDVLREIKKDSQFKDLPIISMYTSSNSPNDKKKALQLGSDRYISKNEDFEEVFLEIKNLMYKAKEIVNLSARQVSLEAKLSPGQAGAETGEIKPQEGQRRSMEAKSDDQKNISD